MRKSVLLLGAVAIFLLPSVSLSDGWGRYAEAKGPKLDKIQEKILHWQSKCQQRIDKLNEKIAKIEAKRDEKLAELEELLAGAEFFGDLEGVAELEEAIEGLLEKYQFKLDKVYDKIVEVQEKYDCKLLKWLLKAGIIPPPPPPDDEVH